MTDIPDEAIKTVALMISTEKHHGHYPEPWAHLYEPKAKLLLQAAAPFMTDATMARVMRNGGFADGIKAAIRALQNSEMGDEAKKLAISYIRALKPPGQTTQVSTNLDPITGLPATPRQT